MLILAVVAGAGGGTAFVMLRQPAEHAQAAKPLGPPQYIAMDPAFVVNLADADSVKYLQADVQLQTRDPETAAAIALHTPLIRNRLLLLFGQQTSQQLTGRAGKERLQAQALNEVRSVLKSQHAPDKVDALLFTSVVIQ
ncbi:flagellar basal body-associated FliL family protein [Thermomonas alba]|uniref:flagellar basal body-associated FliL family protein n=1 Tax=Thermomonas alba TaxID=2888525 RepID=UPI001F0442EC|nr:flagellar basal body-associated FliL family protein [Thermomonas alba]